MKSRIVLGSALVWIVATAAGAAPLIEASLTDAEAKAKKGEATVQVQVSGVQQVHNRLRVEARESGEDDRSADRLAAKGSEGQRSGAGRKAH